MIIDLIFSYIAGKEYILPEDCDISSLYAVSKRHDLAHIVASALEKQNRLPDGEMGSEFKRLRLLAIYRREQLDFEQARICELLQREKIPYITLKGAVLKELYPEKWMRTSCDIDILIPPEHKQRAVFAICGQLGYTQESDGERDNSLIAKSGVNLELHFSLNCDNENLNTVLSRVWDFTLAGNDCERLLTNEFFVFYHIAHMLIHFNDGGCGIRPFIDLWLYKNANNIDEKTLFSLFDESKSLDFYNGVCALLSVWFEGKQHTRLTSLFEEYIISGGVYGSRENLGAYGKHKKGGRFKYLMSRIFMPREKLQLVYPKIDKYPILIPYYWVKRWFTLFNKNTFKTAKSELYGNKKSDSADELLTMLGL